MDSKFPVNIPSNAFPKSKALFTAICTPSLKPSFKTESFISIIKQYKTISFNMLVPIVNYLAENHWHQMLKESLSALKEILQKIHRLK